MAKSTDLQNWRKIAQSWWSKGSKKTFSRPAGLSGTFSILRPALLLFLGIMSTFSILFGSGTLFFSSQTQFLLLYGSNMFFFLSQTLGALPFWHYVNLFPFFLGLARTFSILGPDFCFYAGLIRSFSRLSPGVLFPSGIMSTFFHSLRVWHAIFLLWNFAFSFYQPRIPICLTILHTFFNTASYLFHIYPVS